MKREEIFSTNFIKDLKTKFFQTKFFQLEKNNILIEEKVKFLSDITCLPTENHECEFEIALGFSEADVAIFKEIDMLELSKPFRLLRMSSNKLKIPLVIFELKCGNFVTDSVRARSITARRIKEIFPFCLYIFVGEQTNKTSETIRRQGKDFDAYFIKENKMERKDYEEIFKFVKPYLKRLKSDLLLKN